MPQPMKAKTGTADIMRQGHTTNSQHGSDPKPMSKVKKSRDLKVK